ncbi:MAG TPA: NUDIX hydrolase [Thermodesulfobacteriota bacterium]|nr:NUDIX hydrolase [Thermodesulfobacteriota bacterium]
MKRKYPEHPIIGVGGIIFQQDRVLLVKRGRAPGLGEWSIPGGVVHAGETLREAVVREIFEETHLEVEVLALAKVLERIFRDPDGRVAYHYVLVDFLCQCRGGELKSDSDAQDARFVPLPDLPSYKIATVTLEVIRRAAWLEKNPQAENPPSTIGKPYG